DRAEEYYKRAMDKDTEHANNLGNYAFFLDRVRKDPDRAEEYYKRALDAEPDNPDALGSYALFLDDSRKDPDRAEGYYKRALAVDPGHANNLGNYARLLLEKREDDKAWKVVHRALDEAVADPLRAELYFYMFALAEPSQAEDALRNLIQLIKAGVRSPYWNFDPIIARARQDGHREIEWLPLLSDVITDRADVDVLDQWSAWHST
nr:tetratricopeptide repeat protein [Actinomycetota bacterium]